MYRIKSDTQQVLVPHLFEDGTYGAADPSHGKNRHHISHRVRAANIDELRSYLLKGWPIWMSIAGTRDRRLISRGIIDAAPPSMTPNSARRSKVAIVASAILTDETTPAQLVSRESSFEIAGDSATTFLPLIASMSQTEIDSEIDNPQRLLIGSHVHKASRLDIAYAPFDHVNIGAEIVIVGITPGKQQMREAIADARKSKQLGLSQAELLSRAKVHASFAGTMRSNLIKLMDAVGLNALLGIVSTASLWTVDSHRAHFTSAIRYPTFVNGENYSRSPNMNSVPFLLNCSRSWLKEELVLFPNAVIVPMGDMVSDAIKLIVEELDISSDKVLFGMPHASGANNGTISKFLTGNDVGDGWRDRFVEIKAKVGRLTI